MTEALAAHLKLLTELPSRVHHWQGPEDEGVERDEYLTYNRDAIRQYQRRYYAENRARILVKRRKREGVKKPRA